MLRDYTTEDIYTGKWMLEVRELPSGAAKRTQYTVYCCRGTCFIDITSPEGGSVSCVLAEGGGVSLSMDHLKSHSWSGDRKSSLLPIVGISSLFVEWIPGLIVCPSIVPLEKAFLFSDKTEYTNSPTPCKGKQFVGLVENGLLTALKYMITDRLYVQAVTEVQRFGTFKKKSDRTTCTRLSPEAGPA